MLASSLNFYLAGEASPPHSETNEFLAPHTQSEIMHPVPVPFFPEMRGLKHV